MSVEGQIKGSDLAGVLQLICLRQRPTQLTVMRGGSTACVVVGQGQIVHARAGTLTGEEAVVELLRWQEGIFKITELPGLPERNVRTALTELIVRAAQRGRAHPPGPLVTPAPLPRHAAVPAPAAARRAKEADTALITLFARLERDVARFEGVRAGSRGVAVLPILEAMLARIVDTGVAHHMAGFREADLRQLAGRQAEMTPSLKLASLEGGKIGLGVFREMLASPALDARQRRELFDELMAGSLGMINGLFARIARHLGADDLREEWLETFEAFLTDLTAALDAVKL